MANKQNDIVTAPWMSNEVVTRLPPVRREFDQNSDPTRTRMLREMEKTETQRRDEQLGSRTVFPSAAQTGRGSSMVRQDHPKANLNPPRNIRTGSDNQRFNNLWMIEERDAAMAANKAQSSAERQKQEFNPELTPRYHTRKR